MTRIRSHFHARIWHPLRQGFCKCGVVPHLGAQRLGRVSAPWGIVIIGAHHEQGRPA